MQNEGIAEMLDAKLHGTLLFDYRTGGGRTTGPLSLFGDHSGQVLGDFATTISLKGDVFIAPKASCPVTIQAAATGKNSSRVAAARAI